MALARWLAGMRILAERLDEMHNPPAARIRQTVVHNIPSGGGDFTPITLNVADIDTAGGWDPGDPTKYIVQVPGMYQLSGNVAYDENSTGGRGAGVAVNGAVVIGTAPFIRASITTITTVPIPSVDVYLDVGDEVQLMAYQTSGSGLNTFENDNQGSTLSLRRVRGAAD